MTERNMDDMKSLELDKLIAWWEAGFVVAKLKSGNYAMIDVSETDYNLRRRICVTDSPIPFLRCPSEDCIPEDAECRKIPEYARKRAIEMLSDKEEQKRAAFDIDSPYARKIRAKYAKRNKK